MDKQQIHDLSVAYAGSKMTEYNIDNRESPMICNVDMSEKEIQYLKSAYDFAIKNLSE